MTNKTKYEGAKSIAQIGGTEMTNLEKIYKDTVEGIQETLLRLQDDQCEFCVFDLEDCERNCREWLITWLNSPAPIKPTQAERDICVGLKHLGYEYLARNQKGGVFAYSYAPTKLSDGWKILEQEYYAKIPVGIYFDFIKWEDDEPTWIDGLLVEWNGKH